MKIFKKLMTALLIVAFALPAFAATNLLPSKHHSGFLGKSGKAWYATYSDYYYLYGGTAFKIKFQGTPTADRTITWPDKDGTVAMTTDVSTAAPPVNAVTGAEADTTIAFTAYQGTFTSTLTDKDMFTIQGLGAFGDVSVLRVEQKTGNATDGTVLEVVSADVDVDALLVTANDTSVVRVTGAGALAINGNATIGDNSGTVAVNSSDWDISTAGAMSGIASIAFDNSAIIYNTTVACNNACIKGLRAAPLTLVAAPGADKFVELVSAVLILNYGSEVLTESEDNLVIQYSSGTDITAAIESTGFIDSNADIIKVVLPSAAVDVTAANSINKAVELFNTGDGEFAGNASDDTTLSIRVSYRVHTAGL